MNQSPGGVNDKKFKKSLSKIDTFESDVIFIDVGTEKQPYYQSNDIKGRTTEVL